MADITIRARDVKVETRTSSLIQIEIGDVDVSDIVKEIGQGELLDAIGRNAAIEHFGIEEAESVE